MHFCNILIKQQQQQQQQKWSTYWPSQFSGQKGKQTFIFLGLITR